MRELEGKRVLVSDWALPLGHGWSEAKTYAVFTVVGGTWMRLAYEVMSPSDLVIRCDMAFAPTCSRFAHFWDRELDEVARRLRCEVIERTDTGERTYRFWSEEP